MVNIIKAVLFILGLLWICAGLYTWSLGAGMIGTGIAAILVSLLLDYELGEG